MPCAWLRSNADKCHNVIRRGSQSHSWSPGLSLDLCDDSYWLSQGEIRSGRAEAGRRSNMGEPLRDAVYPTRKLTMSSKWTIESSSDRGIVLQSSKGHKS